MKDYIEAFLQKNKKLRSPVESVHNCIKAGNNRVGSQQIFQSLLIDDNWVDKVNSTLLSIQRIVTNPRIFIKEERQIVSVDRTRKVDGETIRYLARHTSDINDIDDDGAVKPKQLNTGVAEVEVGIYENRVVYALILRIERFCLKAIDEIGDRINTIDTTSLDVTSQYIIDDRKFDCNINMKMDKESSDKVVVEKNKQLLANIKELLKQIKSIKHTLFYKTLSTYKKVVPPINKTNLFSKNIDYKNCYDCWSYLSANNEIECKLSVSSAPIELKRKYFDDISYLILAATLTFAYNADSNNNLLDRQNAKKLTSRKYKILRTVNFDPLLPRTTTANNVDLINQYYFDKMRELINDIKEQFNQKGKTDQQTLSSTFSTLAFKTKRLNLAMFEEALGIKKEFNPTSANPLDRKKEQIAFLEEQIKKYAYIVGAYKRDKTLEVKKQATRVKNLKKMQKQLARLEKIEAKNQAERLIKEQQEAIRKQAELEAKKVELEKLRIEKELAHKAEVELRKQARQAERIKIREQKELAHKEQVALNKQARQTLLEQARLEKEQQHKKEIEEKRIALEKAREEKLALEKAESERKKQERQTLLEQARLEKEQQHKKEVEEKR
ncbi:MAG: hypothetical protein RR207_04845, partial [Clostridia bacterium]